MQLGLRKCPIVGDRRYGARLPFAAGIALHAFRLGFSHPETGAVMTLEAAPPPAWHARFAPLTPFQSR
jgi:23S rRNA pseudouridine1911/1915/1917 synthase